MKHAKFTARLPLVAAGAGLLGGLTRMVLYAVAKDGPWLLKADHPLESFLWGLTLVTVVVLTIWVWGLDGSAAYEHNFARSYPAMAGHLLFAGGILLSVLGKVPATPGFLGGAWKVLGYAAVPSLVAAGLDRQVGRKPAFPLHLIPCLFMMFHIICHYRVWNSAPQLQSYGFAMFGSMALMFFAFYLTGFDVDLGKRRMLLFFGLAATYLCLVEAARTEEGWLYLTGAVFCATNLCARIPTPKPEKPEGKESC